MDSRMRCRIGNSPNSEWRLSDTRRGAKRLQQNELCESTNAQPIVADSYLRRCAEFVVAIRAHLRAGDFYRGGVDRFRRWRDRAPLRVCYEFRQIDGPAGGQNPGGGGVYLTGSAQGGSGVGGNDSGGARFSNHRPSNDCERERKGFAGRKARQTENFLAGRDGNFLSRFCLAPRAALPE